MKLLNNYFNACIFTHALAFFQWREMHGPNSNKKNLIEVIIARV